MKRCVILLLGLLAFTVAAEVSSYAQSNTLPEMIGWINGDLRTTVFDTVSGKRGFWLERDYRNAVGVPFHAVWMEGSGEKGWLPPDKIVSADDGLLGSGSTYKTLFVAGQSSILEHHPITGFSLSVKTGKKGTLTLESNIASEEEITAAAEMLVTEILMLNGAVKQE